MNSGEQVGLPVTFADSSVTSNSMTESGFIVPPESIIVRVVRQKTSCAIEIRPHAFEGFKVVIKLAPDSSRAQVNVTHFTDVGPPFDMECKILRGRITLSHDPFENPHLPVTGTYYLGVAYPPVAEPNNNTEYAIYGSFIEKK
jgi:hypothetical protein